jgi:stage III sporulation protein AE
MKCKAVAVIVLVLLLTPFSCARASEEGDHRTGILESQVENLQMEDMQQVLNSLNDEIKGYLPDINARDMVKSLASGRMDITPGQMLSGIGRYLFAQVLANIGLLAKLVVLSVLYAVLSNIQTSFGNGVVSELAQMSCLLVLIAIAMQSFAGAIGVGSGAIDRMVAFMQALIPTLLALLAAMGGISSMALLQPVIALSIGFFSTLFKNVLIPLILFSAILAIVNNISEKFHLSRLSSLLRQGCVGIIGLALTVFIGIMTIQGAAASTVDGVTIRTAKFAVDSFVPIVGGFMSDAVETIVGCSQLIKNAVGAFGLISIFAIVAFPILKILSIVLIYRVCAAVIEPLAQQQLVKCLNEMATSLMLLFATVASVAFMFFISVTIIIGAGNAALMMR